MTANELFENYDRLWSLANSQVRHGDRERYKAELLRRLRMVPTIRASYLQNA